MNRENFGKEIVDKRKDEMPAWLMFHFLTPLFSPFFVCSCQVLGFSSGTVRLQLQPFEFFFFFPSFVNIKEKKKKKKEEKKKKKKKKKKKIM